MHKMKHLIKTENEIQGSRFMHFNIFASTKIKHIKAPHKLKELTSLYSYGNRLQTFLWVGTALAW